MKTLAAFAVLLVAGLVYSNPINDDDDEIITFNRKSFPESLVVYTSEHDIVKIFCPLNSLNFEEESEDSLLNDTSIYVFFVEADVKDGKTDYKGLSVLRNKQATKLLDNGRDFAASFDDSKKVYLAATDGIYVLNPETNAAEKYGTLTDNFVGLAVSKDSDFLYALTEDHVLYKVTSEGTAKQEVTDVNAPTQMVVDFENNLFYVDSNKDVYVKTADGAVIKIKDVPSSPSASQLIRPSFPIKKGVQYLADDKLYLIYSNGTSEDANIVYEVKPSAMSLVSAVLQYYGLEKKIYEYNVINLLAQEGDKKNDVIKAIGVKSRKAFQDAN